jgi:hypothetical protein
MRSVKNKAVLVFIVSLTAVIGLAWYESLPHTSGPGGSAGYWVIYTLTASGNHTQIQTRYNNGNVYTDQISWLNFNNRTAVYHFFKCTPSMKGCTFDGCTFTVLVDNATEYQVKGGPCGSLDQG